MSLKAKIILGYLATAILATIYLANWGDNAYKGFAYNLGAGLVWPVVVFPGLGKIIGGAILLLVIGAVLAT